MTPEGRIVAAVKRELDKRGIFHINLNGGNGQTGLPDRLAFPPGLVLPIECKAPGTGRVTPKQAWVHEQFAKGGWPVLVVDDVRQLRDRLDGTRGVSTLPARLGIARLVADHWRSHVVRWGDEPMAGRMAAHSLCCVLAALDGETDPRMLGIEDGPTADAIRRTVVGALQ